MTVDPATAEVPVTVAPAVACVTVTVYLPAVVPAPAWTAVAPRRRAVLEIASVAAVVTTALLAATVLAVRRPCAAASESTVNASEPARADGESVALTALVLEIVELSLVMPLVTMNDAWFCKETRLLRKRLTVALCSFTAAWRLATADSGARSADIRPETIEATSMPPAVKPMLEMDDIRCFLVRDVRAVREVRDVRKRHRGVRRRRTPLQPMDYDKS